MPRAPRLLVSVRDAEEALAAVAGGADIIDIKEPDHGSLGRALPETITAIGELLINTTDYAGPLSAALWELRDLPTGFALPPQVNWVKAGLSGMASSPWQDQWKSLRDRITQQTPQMELIAVVYADGEQCGAPAPEDIVSFALSQDVPGILFDTYEKRGRTLLDHVSHRELEGYIHAIHAAGRFVALAGSIGVPQVDELLELQPDILAVRSAVCRGGRQGRVDAALVADVQSAIRAAAFTGRNCR